MMSRPDSTPDRFVDERLVDTAGLTPVADDLRCAVEQGLIRPQVDEIYDQVYETMRAGLRVL
jgi:hypothetical protein